MKWEGWEIKGATTYGDRASHWLHVAFVDEYLLCFCAEGLDFCLRERLALQQGFYLAVKLFILVQVWSRHHSSNCGKFDLVCRVMVNE